MAICFNENDIKQISDSLGSTPQTLDGAYSWRLSNPETSQTLIFYVYEKLDMPDLTPISVVSVQTKQGFFELHNCTHFMIFEPDEVIFINLKHDTVSCLTIGKNATCSVYSDIDLQLLNADITKINSNLLLSAMQLSLLENILTK
jgi:hypothetical protein